MFVIMSSNEQIRVGDVNKDGGQRATGNQDSRGLNHVMEHNTSAWESQRAASCGGVFGVQSHIIIGGSHLRAEKRDRGRPVLCLKSS